MRTDIGVLAVMGEPSGAGTSQGTCEEREAGQFLGGGGGKRSCGGESGSGCVRGSGEESQASKSAFIIERGPQTGC